MKANYFLAFLLLFMPSSISLGSPLGSWQIFDVGKTKLGKNGLAVPLVMLMPQHHSRPMITKANAKDLVKKGQRLLLAVRLMTDPGIEIPLIVEGGLGIIVPRKKLSAAQTIWPGENILAVSDDDFMAMLDSAKRVNAQVNKDGAEPRNVFNGSGNFDFYRDLHVLTTSQNWRSLGDFMIEKATMLVPSQASHKDRSWSCGPNSGARALTLLGQEITDFDGFVTDCPKSWALFVDIGPTPTQLAKFLELKNFQRNISPRFSGYFSSVVNEIRSSIDRHHPLILLLVRSTANMHYVTVIGYNDAEGKVAIMDTLQIIYWMSYSDLEYWMDASGHFLKLFSIDSFNSIYFGDLNRGRSHV